MNMRLDLDAPDTVRTLRSEDIIACVKALVDLRDGRGEIDDIDHLGNRRVRSVGELMENQYRVGLLRMERAIRERMSSVEIDTVMPQDLINAKPAAAAVREFFGSSQLSQFMDQTNPLSEVTHKRRLSALGPGGLTRERAGFEVRDVHPTHYGRMCPIETPEGPNIGLINSLASFARVNKYGFIETPYRHVRDGQVTDEVQYMSATEEMRHTIAQANANLDDEGRLPQRPRLHPQGRRLHAEPAGERRPDRRLAEAARLRRRLADPVPRERRREPRADGLEHAAPGGAAARAPRRRSSAPASRRSWRATRARRSPRSAPASIDQVDAMRIVVRATEDVAPGDPGVDIYRLRKFQRSNQNTCINQRPLVKVGDAVARASSSPTARRPTSASWRSARTCSSPSCPGTATTTRTRSSSPSASSRTTSSPRSTSRSSRSPPATPSSGRRRSPATSPTSARRRCATSTRRASSTSAPRSARPTSWWARSPPRARAR